MTTRFFLIFMALLFMICGLNAQTFWTGPKISFSKGNFVDWTEESNQDRITDSVWITRADEKGLFNIVVESEYDRSTHVSPLGTEWAVGTIADGVENLTFGTWFQSNAGSPPESIGIPKVLHLIAEDIYIDVTITAWTAGGGGSGTTFGGGFAYERSTPTVSATSATQGRNVSISPNPSRGIVFVDGLKKGTKFRVFQLNGAKTREGQLVEDGRIDLRKLAKGIYYIQFENGLVKKIIRT